MSETNEQTSDSIKTTLADIGQRLPAYVKLSHRLVAEGMMSSAQQGRFLGALGYGTSPLSQIPRFIPIIGQISRILSMIGAINYALTQMQPEVADAQLAAVGLTREQVETDLRVSKDLARRAGDVGSQHASRALHDGARIAGRLAGKSVRSFRNWQAKAAETRETTDETHRRPE